VRRITKLTRRLAEKDAATARRDLQLGMEPAGASCCAVDLGKA